MKNKLWLAEETVRRYQVQYAKERKRLMEFVFVETAPADAHFVELDNMLNNLVRLKHKIELFESLISEKRESAVGEENKEKSLLLG